MGHDFAGAKPSPTQGPEDKPKDKEANRTYRLNNASNTATQSQAPRDDSPSQSCNPPPQSGAQEENEPEYPARVGARIPWQELAKFTFQTDLKLCPRCGGAMIIIAAIGAVQMDVIKKIMEHLEFSMDFSEPMPARLPPQLDFSFEEEDGWIDQDDWIGEEVAEDFPQAPS